MVLLGVGTRITGRAAGLVNRQRVRDASSLQDQHAVGQRNGFIDIVGNEQDTEPVLTPQAQQ
jgi:hypothetical protein